MAGLQEARDLYERVFGLEPSDLFDEGQLRRAVDAADDIEFARNLYEKEFGVTISEDDLREAGFLVRAVRASNEEQAGEEEVLPEGATGLLAGGETVRVIVGGESRWYQVYEFPAGSGQFVAYQFNDLNALGAATGDRFPAHAIRSESWFDRNVVAEAPAEQIIGLPGTWQGFSQEIIKDEAALLGINDPSLLGLFASDPEMQAIAAKAAIGDWSATEVRAAQRQTDFWKNTLYPGIENFYSQTTNPEAAWGDYSRNVEGALIELGYDRDADGTYNTQIKRMLDGGVDDETFIQATPVFQQAIQNRKFFDVLNARTQAELGKTLEFGEWFDLLSGEAAPDIQQVAEGAVVAFRAQQADVDLGEGQLQRIISERDLTNQQAAELFSNFNQALIAIGDQGLARYNITSNEILSAAAGISPESGRSIEEVRNLGAKIARENALFDDEKINFYVGYNPRGVPVRQGLAALRPEAG